MDYDYHDHDYGRKTHDEIRHKKIGKREEEHLARLTE